MKCLEDRILKDGKCFPGGILKVDNFINHQIDPVLFPRFEGWPAKFSIIDFYLSICRDVPVYGHLQDDFRLMDVGKLDTLAQAELFLKEI